MLTPLRAPLHGLFSRWVATHHHPRDFVVAIDHAAAVLYADYVLAGAPQFEDESLPEPELLPLPTVLTAIPEPMQRFYDEAGQLGVSRETLQEQRTVLAPLFLAWSMQHYLERDFLVAARESAVGLCYDYSVCCSLGGQLGGGFTGEEFITQPLRALTRPR
jgi:hypothetical protein